MAWSVVGGKSGPRPAGQEPEALVEPVVQVGEDIEARRAAASSTASGTPSSLRQIDATSSAAGASRTRSSRGPGHARRRAGPRRSRQVLYRAALPVATTSAPAGKRARPYRSGSPAVASNWSLGQLRLSGSASSAAATITCSQLSNHQRSDRKGLRPAPPHDPLPASRTPKAVAKAAGNMGRGKRAPGRKDASRRSSATRRAATSSETGLPEPPGPTTVTNRRTAHERAPSACSFSRPTKLLGRVGRSPVTLARAASSGAKSRPDVRAFVDPLQGG